MDLLWSDRGWEDYLSWQEVDIKTLRRLNKIINDIKRSPVISSAVASGKLKILAIYPDEEIEIWRSHLNEIPSSWLNGYDKEQVLRNKHTYDLKAIPTLYLLDENKHVILKDTTVGHIHDYLLTTSR